MRFYSHPPVDLSSSNLRSGPDFHQTSHDETKQTAPKGGREPPRLGRAVQYPARLQEKHCGGVRVEQCKGNGARPGKQGRVPGSLAVNNKRPGGRHLASFAYVCYCATVRTYTCTYIHTYSTASRKAPVAACRVPGEGYWSRGEFYLLRLGDGAFCSVGCVGTRDKQMPCHVNLHRPEASNARCCCLLRV
jgi:hypothetical protein